MAQKYVTLSSTEEKCENCNTVESVFVSLRCDHKFCLECAGYLVLKCITSGAKEGQVRCSLCKQVTELDADISEAINLTIEEKLVPKLRAYRESIQEVSAENVEDEQLDERINLRPTEKKDKVVKRYSEEPSYNHITPSTKQFYSKCDSPANDNAVDNVRRRDRCPKHVKEQLSFVCINCHNQLLCHLCLPGKHAQHEIKNFGKGIQLVSYEVSRKRMQLAERLEAYQVSEKRLEAIQSDVGDRWTKTKEHISKVFEQLTIRLKQREADLLQLCNEHYSSLTIGINRELERLASEIARLRPFMTDIRTLSMAGYSTNETERSQNPTEFFALYNKIDDALRGQLAEHVQTGILSKVNEEASAILWLQERDITPIYDMIAKIDLIEFQIGMGNHHKKPHTKFTSLNSSREKKKKYAKTEQDEMFQCGLKRKTEHNIEGSEKMSRKGSNKKGLPKYLTIFPPNHMPMRQSHKLLDNSILEEFDSVPRLNGCKTSSKLLSRSIVPAESVHKKKKDAQHKERVERKTTNPMEILRNQKNLFETKKKKPSAH